MKGPDLDKERSEKKLSLADFLKAYNEKLPEAFPRASVSYLRLFGETYPSLFKEAGVWSLDLHRKRFMDWLPSHIKTLELRA